MVLIFFIYILYIYIYMVLIFFKIGPYIWDNIGQEWEASLESKVELNYKCVKRIKWYPSAWLAWGGHF